MHPSGCGLAVPALGDHFRAVGAPERKITKQSQKTSAVAPGDPGRSTFAVGGAGRSRPGGRVGGAGARAAPRGRGLYGGPVARGPGEASVLPGAPGEGTTRRASPRPPP